MAIRWGAVARGEVGVRRGGGDDVARRGNAVQPPTFSRRSTEAHLSLRFLSEIWRSSEEGKGQGRRVLSLSFCRSVVVCSKHVE